VLDQPTGDEVKFFIACGLVVVAMLDLAGGTVAYLGKSWEIGKGASANGIGQSIPQGCKLQVDGSRSGAAGGVVVEDPQAQRVRGVVSNLGRQSQEVDGFPLAGLGWSRAEVSRGAPGV
jgi:hypothetical protein